MQGDIRRKKDLLPRYKTGSKYNSRRRGGYLTTPMKKIIVYIILLCGVYFVIKVAYSDLNKETEIKLESHSSDVSASASEHTNIAAGGAADATNNKQPQQAKVPKEKFNNEVAKQQEVKNLENDLKPQIDSEKQKQINKDKKEQKQQLQKEKQDLAKENLANNEILDN
ncbi:ANL_collapsed_G0033160.mRNA.1.CDS.1 [Saccharomyces cerevisiae]|nr:ANL_HP_G0029230.mRNA.1.CDS.1 [Saccharomyces cerevisiae]CAI4975836.1 ANL_HP_G0035370.mRNA.1.CDS.1 [Saccharomyces cerevisiae]CAI5136117.1 ANL_HP_G0117280.mRNA.1.CDS.1 [Saccharomyces cerevisiae]CAI5214695.1 ANL_HP_G0173970.mRNA.1.CDS.1 [Saccharomyces cerevisiae]CAI6709569.1 ANL_HP_G0029230.mRNA.1.CDS.1 [Saccharomyces cerevisiae]